MEKYVFVFSSILHFLILENRFCFWTILQIISRIWERTKFLFYKPEGRKGMGLLTDKLMSVQQRNSLEYKFSILFL